MDTLKTLLAFIDQIESDQAVKDVIAVFNAILTAFENAQANAATAATTAATAAAAVPTSTMTISTGGVTNGE